MRKIFLFVFILSIYILLNSKLFPVFTEKIDLGLRNDEIAITFVNSNLLISRKVISDLLLLNDEKEKDLSRFDINILNLISINKYLNIKNLKYNNKYLLEKNLNIDEVYYNVEDNILSIKYKDTTFCIYINTNDEIQNTRMCNFLYLYNNNYKNIDIDENLDIIFLNEKSSIPIYFLEDIYSKWIDVYTIKDKEYITIKVGYEDYNMFIIPNE